MLSCSCRRDFLSLSLTPAECESGDLLLAASAPKKWRSRRGRDYWRPPPVRFRRQPRMPGIFNASRIATGLPGSDLPEIQTGNEIPNLRDGRMSWNGLLLLIRVFFFCLWELNELNPELLVFL